MKDDNRRNLNETANLVRTYEKNGRNALASENVALATGRKKTTRKTLYTVDDTPPREYAGKKT